MSKSVIKDNYTETGTIPSLDSRFTIQYSKTGNVVQLWVHGVANLNLWEVVRIASLPSHLTPKIPILMTATDSSYWRNYGGIHGWVSELPPSNPDSGIFIGARDVVQNENVEKIFVATYIV